MFLSFISQNAYLFSNPYFCMTVGLYPFSRQIVNGGNFKSLIKEVVIVRVVAPIENVFSIVSAYSKTTKRNKARKTRLFNPPKKTDLLKIFFLVLTFFDIFSLVNFHGGFSKMTFSCHNSNVQSKL